MAQILPETEVTEFENRSYVNPQAAVDESGTFIDNLRQTQQANTGQIAQDTYTDESTEIWADIPKYKGKYQVSTKGRVRSLLRGKERVLTPWLTTGYPTVSLGRRNKQLVHRLVAEAFIPNPERRPQVNHKNGDRADNRVSNLEWVSSQENILHRGRVLGHYITPIAQYTLSGKMVNIWKGVYLACETLGISHSNIIAVANGRRKSAGGFLWKYTEKGRR